MHLCKHKKGGGGSRTHISTLVAYGKVTGYLGNRMEERFFHVQYIHLNFCFFYYILYSRFYMNFTHFSAFYLFQDAI